MNEDEKDILDQARQALAALAPPGTRWATDDGTPIHLAGLHLVCAGADAGMAYYCCLPVGHAGRCYSASKQVSFLPYPERK